MRGITICFAGKRGSGKSTISSLIATELRLQLVSFGDSVRGVANQQGLEPSTEVLQHIGNTLIEGGVERFCRLVLSQVHLEPGESVVVDGIRHLEVFETLKHILSPNEGVLIYVSLDETKREKRLQKRDGTSKGALKSIDSHSTEIQPHSVLPNIADLIVDGSLPPDDLKRTILSWLEQRNRQ